MSVFRIIYFFSCLLLMGGCLTTFLRASGLMLVLLGLLFGSCQSLKIRIINCTDIIAVTSNQGQILPQFTAPTNDISCIMPKLFIYNETIHEKYTVQVEGSQVTNVIGKYRKVQAHVKCKSEEGVSQLCQVSLNNGCEGDGTNQMNWIIIQLKNNDGVEHDVEYLVNCNPNKFYKPFEWGLFITICFCTMTITVSSMYSRAWSYKNIGINISKTFITIFNIIVIVASILAYYLPSVTALILKIVGSVAGTLGVMVCVSETLWLVKSRKLNEARFGPIRFLDIISFFTGALVVLVYWLTNGMWIVNDVLAVCMIVAGIKIFKIRSLSNGIFMLVSLLLIQIVAGLIVHYILKTSYNNLVIQMFQSPLVIAFPSITPEFYRRCAWIPVTNILFPGLLISYLRRFDKARGTFLYLLIGYCSFYVGSILWMIVDMSTIHSLPMAIISDPVTILGVAYFAMRRNQWRTLWDGRFYDPQLPDVTEQVLPAASVGDNYIAISELTDSLRIEKNRESQISSTIQV